LRRPAAGAPEEAQVEGLTHEGEGVVHGGKTAFVAGALPGERIRFHRTRRHRQHDDAELIEVLQASPARAAPRCPHFGVCGGCVLQHLSPAAQLAAKEGELREALARVARVEPVRWLSALDGPHWGYRRRARLGAKFVRKKDTVVVGFRERAAPFITQLRSCDVLAPPAGELIAPLAAMLTGLSIREQVPQIEVAVAANGTALVLRVLEAPSQQDVARLEAFAAEHGVRLFLQPGGLDSVREDLTPAARVLDLYCGLGNFSLPLARHTTQVVGIEGDAALVARARDNARHNGLVNAEFHAADLAAPPDAALPWLRHRYTHVLLDPPRTGARAVLAAVARIAPQRLLYISCHPGSLARDLGVLVHEHGFALAAAGVVDMFPHTAHVESLALLTAGASPGAAAVPA